MSPRPHIANADLRAVDVPPSDAPWPEIIRFGHAFHAYRVAGSVQRVSALAADAHDVWTADGPLPADLTKLRVVLFATVRALDNTTPTDDDRDWATALLDAIRAHLPQPT